MWFVQPKVYSSGGANLGQVINVWHMHMRLTVIYLSVCLLPIYWLFHNSIQHTEYTSWIYAVLQRSLTNEFSKMVVF